MKKKASKKLVLSRETLKVLEESFLKQAPGGQQSLETLCLQCYPDTGESDRC
jgi:hypothetical protein